MNSIATHVGIDVSKGVLEAFIDRLEGRKRLQVANDEKGIRALLDALGEGEFVVSMESTGRYEALARRELEAAGIEVRVQNPRRMRRLAEGLGYEAKTDAIDALNLASTVGICKGSVPRSKLREELGDLSRTIDALTKERSGHKKRLQSPGFSQEAKRRLNALIEALDQAIAGLAKDYDAKVKRSELARNYALAQTVPGVAERTAPAAISELPEDLSRFTLRQISSYGALCPVDDASGKRVGPSRLKTHGNMHLKAAFYMPAINQIGNAPWARDLYRRLRSQGRTHQQAIVPIMRRILLRVVAVLKRGSAWEADPPHRP